MDCLFKSLAPATARKARKRIMVVKVHQVWRASCAGSGLVLVRRTGWCAWLPGALLPQRLPEWVLAWQCGGGYTTFYLPSLHPLSMPHLLKPKILDICRPRVLWELHEFKLNQKCINSWGMTSAWCGRFLRTWYKMRIEFWELVRPAMSIEATHELPWWNRRLPKGEYGQCLSSRVGIIHKRVWFNFNTAGWVKVKKEWWRPKNALTCFLVPVLRTVASHPAFEVSSDLNLDRGMFSCC